jgi:hypothetical protein
MSIIRSNIARQLLAEGGAPRKGYVTGGDIEDDVAQMEMDMGISGGPGPSEYSGMDQESQAEVDQARFDAGFRTPDYINMGVSDDATDRGFFQRSIDALGAGLQNRRGQSIMNFLGRSTAPTVLGKLGLGNRGDINYILEQLQSNKGDPVAIGLTPKQFEIGQKLIDAGIRDEFDIRNMTQSQFDTLFPGPQTGEGGDSEPIRRLRAPITEKKEEPKSEFDDILKFYGARFEDGGDVRQEYGLGSIVKKAVGAVKKVAKSPIGKAALFAAPFIKFPGMQSSLFAKAFPNMANDGILKSIFMKDDKLNPFTTITAASLLAGALAKKDEEDETLPTVANTDPEMTKFIDFYGGPRRFAAEGGMMEQDEMLDLGGKEMDLRGGGFVPLGEYEKKDDVPARLSKNEFVFTADAVRAAGGGSVDKGADVMYKTMKTLENKVA